MPRKPSTHQCRIPEAEIACLVATRAIRRRQWLCLALCGYGQVLFVADEDLTRARAQYPNLPLREINNARKRMDPKA